MRVQCRRLRDRLSPHQFRRREDRIVRRTAAWLKAGGVPDTDQVANKRAFGWMFSTFRTKPAASNVA